MKLNYYLKTKIPFLMGLIALVGLSSCGSYQYVGHDTDGIYDTSEKKVESKQQVASTNEDKKDNSYYKDYFKQKSSEFENVTEEGAVFTDIDSYEGNHTEEVIAENQVQSHPGWGQDNTTVSINVFPSAGFGMYNSWGWGNRWGNRGFGWGAGWNRPWGYGFNSFYDPFWCPTFGGGFYGGYGHPYYNRFGRNNNYYGRGLAYNSSRRGNLSRSNNTGRVNNSSRVRTNTTRTRSTSRPSSTRGSRGNSVRTRPSSRPSSSNNTIRTRPSSRPSSNNTIRTRPSSSGRSISRPSSNSNNYRSSGSSSSRRSSSSGRPRGL